MDAKQLHKLHQQANDWCSCRCGKIFANRRNGKDKALKYQKLNKHLEEVGGEVFYY